MSDTEHPCIECGEPTFNPERCRDCGIEHDLDRIQCAACKAMRWLPGDETTTAFALAVWGEPCRCTPCAHCGIPLPYNPDQPPHSIENGVHMVWCGSACSEAWMDADPRRREGWVSFDGMSNEQIAKHLAEIGLGIKPSNAPN